MTNDNQQIENIDLYNNNYKTNILIKNINRLDLVEILKTQYLDVDFITNYILNKKY